MSEISDSIDSHENSQFYEDNKVDINKALADIVNSNA